MALTTLAKLKAHLMIAESDTSDDARLTAAVAEILARAAGLLNERSIEIADHELILDGDGTDTIVVPQYPITSDAVEAWIDGDRVFGDDTQVAAENVAFDAQGGIVFYLAGVWPLGRRNIKLAFEAGLATVPADLELACNMAAASFYQRSKQLEGGQAPNELASESIAGGRTDQYRSEMTRLGIPSPAAAIFNRYRTET